MEKMRKLWQNRVIRWTFLSLCFQAAFVVYQYVVGKGNVYGWVEDGIRVGLLFLLFRGVTLPEMRKSRHWPAFCFALFISLSLIRYNMLRYDLEGFSWAYVLLFLKDFVLYFLLVKAMLVYVEKGRYPALEMEQSQRPGFWRNPVFWGMFALTLLGLCMQWRALYFPARTSPDTMFQWDMIHGQAAYDDVYAIGHTIFLKALVMVWDHQAFLILVQLMMMAVLAGLFADFLCRRGVPFAVMAVLVTLYQCLLPASFYMYAWKDNPYAFVVGLVTYFILRSLEEERFSPLQSILLGGSLAWMMLFRQNGVVPLIFCSIYFLWYFLRRRQWLQPLLALVTAVVCFLGVWFVGYKVLHAESPKNGYAYQVFGSGIAAVVANDGDISPELMERIEAYLPVEYMKAVYEPWNNRNLIWGTEEIPYNNFHAMLGDNAEETISIYLALLPRNLGLMARDVLYNTYEVWGIMYLFSNATMLVLLCIAMAGAWRGRKLGGHWVALLPVLASALSIAISTITNEIRYLQPTYTLFVPLLLYILYLPMWQERAAQKMS